MASSSTQLEDDVAFAWARNGAQTVALKRAAIRSGLARTVMQQGKVTALARGPFASTLTSITIRPCDA
jgi:hypothetical protein